MNDGENVVLHVKNRSDNYVDRQCPERCSSMLIAGCLCRPSLTLRMKADSPSKSRRILGIMIGKFGTEASTNHDRQVRHGSKHQCLLTAGKQHWCVLSAAAQMHIKKRVFSTPTASSC